MKFFIILFASFIVNTLCNLNNYQIYYKSQLRNLLEEEKNQYIQMLIDYEFNNITSLMSSILIKIKNIFSDIDINTELFKNIINNYNRLRYDDDISNIYTLFW